MGLAFGMTQIGYVGAQLIKFFYAALKHSFKLIFNFNNILYPIKFISKYVFGIDNNKSAHSKEL